VPEQRIVEFIRLIESTRLPKRAERAAAGYIPARALRYCDALTSATGYGYWVFPPMDFRLIWDGEQISWSYGSDETWMPLTGTDSSAVQFPYFASVFDEAAPEALRGYSPPFLTAIPEQGGVQMWTGLLARTRPGWSLSVRPPVNLPAIPNTAAWKGSSKPISGSDRCSRISGSPERICRFTFAPTRRSPRCSRFHNWRIERKH